MRRAMIPNPPPRNARYIIRRQGEADSHEFRSLPDAIEIARDDGSEDGGDIWMYPAGWPDGAVLIASYGHDDDITTIEIRRPDDIKPADLRELAANGDTSVVMPGGQPYAPPARRTRAAAAPTGARRLTRAEMTAVINRRISLVDAIVGALAAADLPVDSVPRRKRFAARPNRRTGLVHVDLEISIPGNTLVVKLAFERNSSTYTPTVTWAGDDDEDVEMPMLASLGDVARIVSAVQRARDAAAHGAQMEALEAPERTGSPEATPITPTMLRHIRNRMSAASAFYERETDHDTEEGDIILGSAIDELHTALAGEFTHLTFPDVEIEHDNWVWTTIDQGGRITRVVNTHHAAGGYGMLPREFYLRVENDGSSSFHRADPGGADASDAGRWSGTEGMNMVGTSNDLEELIARLRNDRDMLEAGAARVQRAIDSVTPAAWAIGREIGAPEPADPTINDRELLDLIDSLGFTRPEGDRMSIRRNGQRGRLTINISDENEHRYRIRWEGVAGIYVGHVCTGDDVQRIGVWLRSIANLTPPHSIYEQRFHEDELRVMIEAKLPPGAHLGPWIEANNRAGTTKARIYRGSAPGSSNAEIDVHIEWSQPVNNVYPGTIIWPTQIGFTTAGHTPGIGDEDDWDLLETIDADDGETLGECLDGILDGVDIGRKLDAASTSFNRELILERLRMLDGEIDCFDTTPDMTHWYGTAPFSSHFAITLRGGVPRSIRIETSFEPITGEVVGVTARVYTISDGTLLASPTIAPPNLGTDGYCAYIVAWVRGLATGGTAGATAAVASFVPRADGSASVIEAVRESFATTVADPTPRVVPPAARSFLSNVEDRDGWRDFGLTTVGSKALLRIGTRNYWFWWRDDEVHIGQGPVSPRQPAVEELYVTAEWGGAEDAALQVADGLVSNGGGDVRGAALTASAGSGLVRQGAGAAPPADAIAEVRASLARLGIRLLNGAPDADGAVRFHNGMLVRAPAGSRSTRRPGFTEITPQPDGSFQVAVLSDDGTTLVPSSLPSVATVVGLIEALRNTARPSGDQEFDAQLDRGGLFFQWLLAADVGSRDPTDHTAGVMGLRDLLCPHDDGAVGVTRHRTTQDGKVVQLRCDFPTRVDLSINYPPGAPAQILMQSYDVPQWGGSPSVSRTSHDITPDFLDAVRAVLANDLAAYRAAAGRVANAAAYPAAPPVTSTPAPPAGDGIPAHLVDRRSDLELDLELLEAWVGETSGAVTLRVIERTATRATVYLGTENGFLQVTRRSDATLWTGIEGRHGEERSDELDNADDDGVSFRNLAAMLYHLTHRTMRHRDQFPTVPLTASNANRAMRASFPLPEIRLEGLPGRLLPQAVVEVLEDLNFPVVPNDHGTSSNVGSFDVYVTAPGSTAPRGWVNLRTTANGISLSTINGVTEVSEATLPEYLVRVQRGEAALRRPLGMHFAGALDQFLLRNDLYLAPPVDNNARRRTGDMTPLRDVYRLVRPDGTATGVEITKIDDNLFTLYMDGALRGNRAFFSPDESYHSRVHSRGDAFAAIERFLAGGGNEAPDVAAPRQVTGLVQGASMAPIQPFLTFAERAGVNINDLRRLLVTTNAHPSPNHPTRDFDRDGGDLLADITIALAMPLTPGGPSEEVMISPQQRRRSFCIYGAHRGEQHVHATDLVAWLEARGVTGRARTAPAAPAGPPPRRRQMASAAPLMARVSEEYGLSFRQLLLDAIPGAWYYPDDNELAFPISGNREASLVFDEGYDPERRVLTRSGAFSIFTQDGDTLLSGADLGTTLRELRLLTGARAPAPTVTAAAPRPAEAAQRDALAELAAASRQTPMSRLSPNHQYPTIFESQANFEAHPSGNRVTFQIGAERITVNVEHDSAAVRVGRPRYRVDAPYGSGFSGSFLTAEEMLEHLRLPRFPGEEAAVPDVLDMPRINEPLLGALVDALSTRRNLFVHAPNLRGAPTWLARIAARLLGPNVPAVLLSGRQSEDNWNIESARGGVLFLPHLGRQSVDDLGEGITLERRRAIIRAVNAIPAEERPLLIASSVMPMTGAVEGFPLRTTTEQSLSNPRNEVAGGPLRRQIAAARAGSSTATPALAEGDDFAARAALLELDTPRRRDEWGAAGQPAGPPTPVYLDTHQHDRSIALARTMPVGTRVQTITPVPVTVKVDQGEMYGPYERPEEIVSLPRGAVGRVSENHIIDEPTPHHSHLFVVTFDRPYHGNTDRLAWAAVDDEVTGPRVRYDSLPYQIGPAGELEERIAVLEFEPPRDPRSLSPEDRTEAFLKLVEPGSRVETKKKLVRGRDIRHDFRAGAISSFPAHTTGVVTIKTPYRFAIELDNGAMLEWGPLERERIGDALDIESEGAVRARMIENPPWTTQLLAKHLEKLEEECPSKWLPKLKHVHSHYSNVIGKYREYGCGAYGCVFPTLDKDVVLKVTTDDSEFEFANDINGDLPVAVCVDYHLVAELPEKHKGSKVYLLWRDSADRVGELDKVISEAGRDGDAAEAAVTAQHAAAQDATNMIWAKKDATSQIEAWKVKCREMGARVPELRELADGLLRNLEEAGVFFGDIHGGNIGRVNGRWLIVDPGNISVFPREKRWKSK
jgi:hypothetical protein